MRTPVAINILFLIFVFIFQLYSPEYQVSTIIENEGVKIVYDRPNLQLTVNGIDYKIEEEDIQESLSVELVRWDTLYQIFLCLLLISLNCKLARLTTVVKTHRNVFWATCAYFLYYMVSEIACYINPNLYDDFIAELHIVVSGTFMTLAIFAILTYKIFKE